MIYALDTNVIIHYLKGHDEVKNNLNKAAFEGCQLIIPRAVDYEICRGLLLLSATKKIATYNEILSLDGQFKIASMGENIWEYAKNIYVQLKRKGFTVGEIDMLIGAFCLHHDYTLVTDNTKDFVNINGLRLVNWTEAL